jgi:hypothetical protein
MWCNSGSPRYSHWRRLPRDGWWSGGLPDTSNASPPITPCRRPKRSWTFVRRMDGSNLRYTKDSIIQRSGLGRTLFPSPAETRPFFQRIQVGAMHNRLLSTRHLTRYLASVRRALPRRIQQPPTPTRWNNLYAPRPRMNVPTYSPFLKTTAPLGKTYSSMSIQNSTTSAPERAQSAADEPV